MKNLRAKVAEVSSLSETGQQANQMQPTQATQRNATQITGRCRQTHTAKQNVGHGTGHERKSDGPSWKRGWAAGPGPRCARLRAGPRTRLQADTKQKNTGYQAGIQAPNLHGECVDCEWARRMRTDRASSGWQPREAVSEQFIK